MKTHLELFGVTCKDPEQLSSGTRVLGIYVWEEYGKLKWRLKIPDILTCCAVFSVCGWLTGHFPVCGWLHVAATFVNFYERGVAPVELLTDNATTFSGETFSKFPEHWGVQIRFQCAYVLAGNGIVERSHRTIKRIATRTRCSVMEAVYWYNVTPKDDTVASTAPAVILLSGPYKNH